MGSGPALVTRVCEDPFGGRATRAVLAVLRIVAIVGLVAVCGAPWPGQAQSRDWSLSDPAFGPRIALVIGNSAYVDVPLRNPASDARLMAATLRQVGFDVAELIDGGQKAMKRAIRDFGDDLHRAGPDAVGLFYYAGHGVQVRGENYLIPIDAPIRRESDVDIEAVTASGVLRQMEFARNRINIVVLDACRNNPFARSFRSATQGLARMDAPRGSLIAYATAPGRVAADGEGRNSPYTAALAEEITRPGVKLEQAFKQVRRQVIAATDDQQVPWESSSLTGDFYFVPGSGTESIEGNGASGPAPAGPKSDIGAQAETLFWQSISESDDPALYRSYLDRFPDGLFAPIARARLESAPAEPDYGGLLPPPMPRAGGGSEALAPPSLKRDDGPQTGAPGSVEPPQVAALPRPVDPVPPAPSPPAPALSLDGRWEGEVECRRLGFDFGLFLDIRGNEIEIDTDLSERFAEGESDGGNRVRVSFHASLPGARKSTNGFKFDGAVMPDGRLHLTGDSRSRESGDDAVAVTTGRCEVHLVRMP